MANVSLSNAKRAKNDEFYTQLSDIENELKHYKSHFAGKVVYCNCDDARKSNFFRFFQKKFNDYGLKKLITTSYNENGHGSVLVYEGDTNGNGKLDDSEIKVSELKGNGDFRSEECIELLKEADIVVTNPPFSLFREYIATLVQYNKKFLVIGNQNAITYKEIFPLIKENKLWTGNNMVKTFRVPQVTNKNCEVLPNGDIIANIKLGIENSITAHIIAAIIKLGITPANALTAIVSNNGIALVNNAGKSKIFDNLSKLASLSALFPPIQYPKLILTNIMPIILVHTTFELPTYGDRTLAAISSSPIPIAPLKNTVISNLYFFI